MNKSIFFNLKQCMIKTLLSPFSGSIIYSTFMSIRSRKQQIGTTAFGDNVR